MSQATNIETAGLGQAVIDEPASSKQRFNAWIERFGERLNPILVKESRQALKSNQFLITFTLLLACAWGWSVLGVALLSPGVRYAPGGPFMLCGYFIVLTVPLLLIVPFSAFRSIAAERDDGTFELLSITSLSAWQIVTGKLGSAVVQMMVYYSALAPCIAFTYLLRGIDVVGIGFVLLFTLMASLLLSSFALMWGTLSCVRHWQVVLSVLLLLILIPATFAWTVGFVAIISQGISQAYDDPDFWMVQLVILTMALSFAALFVLAAAARISFESDDRSTKLRICMLVQQTMWTGWLVLAWLRIEEEEVLYAGASAAALYWLIIGSLISGEREHLSARVRRKLPQSFLARSLFTWLNPGPVTGYFFVVANFLALGVTLALAFVLNSFASGNTPSPSFTYLPLLVAYVVLYLGICRLLLATMRSRTQTGMLFSFLIHVLVAALGVTIPLFTVARLRGYAQLEYDTIQWSNWAWSLVRAAEGDIPPYDPVFAIVLLSAVIVLALNIAFSATRTKQLRIATPERVIEEEELLHPSGRENLRTSPWDD